MNGTSRPTTRLATIAKEPSASGVRFVEGATVGAKCGDSNAEQRHSYSAAPQQKSKKLLPQPRRLRSAGA